MGQYNGAVITTAGQAVLAQAIGGAELTITKVVTSATAIPPGTDLTALTAIADVEQTAQPTSVQVFNDNIVQISTRFSNAGVAAAYLIQTLGVFGQVTGGAETLLAVSTAITPDQMPAEDAIAPSAFIYNIQLTVQSADQITVTVNDAGTATVADVQALDAAKLGKSGDGENVTVTFDETADPDVTSFATFLNSIVSGLTLSKLLRVIKTGLSYIAPKNHAANDVAYGGGDTTNYGHVRLSDVYNSQIGTAAQSIGASQKSVYDAYNTLNSKISGTHLIYDSMVIILSTGDGTKTVSKCLTEAINTLRTLNASDYGAESMRIEYINIDTGTSIQNFLLPISSVGYNYVSTYSSVTEVRCSKVSFSDSTHLSVLSAILSTTESSNSIGAVYLPSGNSYTDLLTRVPQSGAAAVSARIELCK